MDPKDAAKDQDIPAPSEEGGIAEHQPPYGWAAPEAEAPEAEAPESEAAPGVEPEPEPPAGTLAGERLRGVLESLLLASDRPLSLDRLVEILQECPRPVLQGALARLAEEALQQGRGIQFHEVAGGYQLRTAPENAEYVQRMLQQKPVKLTRAQLETLAIISYRQPITRPEIDDVRGVDSGGTLKTLLERHLIRILGKREEPGRPILYGTTREFLEFFNLRDLKDLPTLREFYELSEEHQAQVASIGAPLEDNPNKKPPPPSPVPPTPLGRVELKDLNLGDDESESQKIDEMIAKVRTDFSFETVMAQAGVTAPPPSATNPTTKPDKADKADRAEMERPPEEL